MDIFSINVGLNVFKLNIPSTTHVREIVPVYH